MPKEPAATTMPERHIEITAFITFPEGKTFDDRAAANTSAGEIVKKLQEAVGKDGTVVWQFTDGTDTKPAKKANGLTRTRVVKRTGEPAGTLPFQPPAPGVDQDAAA